MRKKLVLICMLLSSLFCLFACSNDPYKDMQLVKSIDNESVQLSIKETDTNAGPVYTYEDYSFDVQVKNVSSDTSKYVELSGGEGIVTYSKKYMGNGITRITVTPISSSQTGKFTLVVKTLEGNKSLSIDFKVDLLINSFKINSDNLKVVVKGSTLDLRDLGKYITFDPVETTQKDIEFSIADIESMGQVSGVIYEYDAQESNVYAKIENNVLTTFDKNADGSDVVYPVKSEEIVLNGQITQLRTQSIPIKVSYIGSDAIVDNADGSQSEKLPAKYIDLEVIEDCSDVQLLMNFQQNTNDSYDGDGKSFAVEPNSDGEYDVVLLDPDYRYGVHYDSYFIERDLKFFFGTITDNVNIDDYKIISDSILESDNKPIVMSYSSVDNTFKVQAQNKGEYSHKFRIEHVRYPGALDKEITVNFKVLSIPTDLKVNGDAIKDGYKVYDYYANSYGARFNIDLNGSQNLKYFVFVDDPTFAQNLTLYRQDGMLQNLAYVVEENGVKVVYSSKEGEPYSNFNDNGTFFLKHNFEVLPEDLKIYIGVMYNVGSLYSEDIQSWYFNDSFVSFPLNIQLENGLRDLAFTQSKYMMDLTNQAYIDGEEDINGIKLLDLPKGQTIGSAIASMTYNQDLINVYSIYDEENNINSLYVKCNDDYIVGETDLVLITKNGLKRSVKIKTFLPTVYANNYYSKQNQTAIDEEKEYSYPIGVSFENTDILYYFTGNSEIINNEETNVQKKYLLYKSEGDNDINWARYEYISLEKLFLLNNTATNFRFYDYLTLTRNNQQVVVPVDITDKVKVSFNYNSYVAWKNNKIYTYKVTENIYNPIIMTIKYIGEYMEPNDEGVLVYKTKEFVMQTELYIYLPLQGVEVTTAKNVDLYLDESLGYNDTDFAVHRIKSDFIPNESKLGADWNQKWHTTDVPVNIFYDKDKIIDESNYIYLSNGEKFTIYSIDGTETYDIRYKDLFALSEGVDTKENVCYCEVVCTISDELKNWINANGGSNGYDWYLRKIFSENITLVVNVYITQFNKLQNINSVKINAKYANKINGYSLDIADDGVYFEIRDGVTPSSQIISYSISNSDVVNKNLMIINPFNNIYNAQIKASTMGNSGTITITPNGSAGEIQLQIVPEDNIKSYNDSTGEYTFYDNSLLQSFRIMVSDGSSDYPYEIKSISDYQQMQKDVSNSEYYYYKLTTNINLNEIPNAQIIFGSTSVGSKTFGLNGQHTYLKNGITYTNNNVLYNYTFKGEISSIADTEKYNIGLFSNIGSNVILRNISINNAYIDVKLGDNFHNTLNIGILAGTALSSQIYNTQVSGTIRIINSNISSATLNVGGMIGYSSGVNIIGLPISYQAGISNSAYNSNVYIAYQMLDTDASNIYNVGGLIGSDTNSALSDLNILSTIYGSNYSSSVGALIGLSGGSSINNTVIYPCIKITSGSQNLSGQINASTFVGNGNAQIYASKVYFVRELNSNYIDNAGVYINTPNNNLNFGGFIGSLNNGETKIGYSYIRGFNSEFSESYSGNIYIWANEANSNVNGMIGDVNETKISISSSYFNADLTSNSSNIALISNNKFGVGSKILNSYAIGDINTIALVDGVETLIRLDNINADLGLISNISLSDLTGSFANVESSLIQANSKKSATLSNLGIDNVYGVVNTDIYYFGEANNLIQFCDYDGVNNKFNPLTEILGINVSEIPNIYKFLGYNLINESEDADSSTNTATWLWNKDVNILDNIAFPMIFAEDSTEVLYDLIPEQILVNRISSDLHGFYDISYSDSDIIYSQILMFVNTNKNQTKNDFYEIKVDNDASAISITFNGKSIISRFLRINGDIEITEDSGGKVLSLIGSRIYPKSEGMATLTITSTFDKTIKLDILFKVVNGITGINIIEKNSTREIGLDVYVDEVSNFELQNINVLDNISYIAGNKYGYKLQILDAGYDNAKLKINENEYIFDSENTSNNIVYLDPSVNLGSLSIMGIKTGIFKFKLTPYVMLDDLEFGTGTVERFEIPNITSETFVINSKVRARNINIDKDSIKIASKNTTTFKLILETGNVGIESVDSSNANVSIFDNIYLQVGLSKYDISLQETTYLCTITDGIYSYLSNDVILCEINHELIKLRLKTFTLQKTNIDPDSRQNTYKIAFDFSVEFNQTYYRAHSERFDLNTLKYNFKFIPSSNDQIFDNIAISISPNDLSEIFYNFYCRGDILDNSGYIPYPNENESNFVVPGRNGLLKLTLDEEFSNSSYLTVTLDKSYESYVTISQMAGVVSPTNIEIDSSGAISTDNISNYTNIMFEDAIESSSEYGIRLSKMSLNYLDSNYFGKTYFVKLFLNRNYGNLTSIKLKATSYKVTNNGTSINYTRDITLYVTQLPQLEVKVDKEYMANLGLGIEKPIDINYRGLTNDIEFKFSSENDDVYIADDNGNKIINSLSLDYLNLGRKYYIRANVNEMLIGKKILVDFKATETVLGVTEINKQTLTLNLVDFEINSIAMSRAVDSQITLKHGEKYNLTTDITFKNITIGDSDKINLYKAQLTDVTGAVSLAEMACTGTSITNILTNRELRLYRKTYINGEVVYEKVVVKDYDYFSITEETLNKDSLDYLYYAIYATSITLEQELNFRLVIPYGYTNGRFVVDNIGYETIEIDFSVVIKDNSTYDHPNPIETQDDLYKACLSDAGDYILLNNITLQNWIPMPANFDSLDGNGYRIILGSNAFNLTAIRSNDSVDAGIFTNTSEKTLLKNLIVDVNGLLVSENEMLNKVSEVSNSNASTYIYSREYIDLAFVKNVNFGVIVGVNNGSITNAKIINSRASNTTLYLHVVTTQGFIDNQLVNSNIGVVAGTNSGTGAITNSFVGLNVSNAKVGMSSIECVYSPSSSVYNNEKDELKDLFIYPFTLAGGNNIAGLTASSSGIISNSYAKGLGIYNTYTAVTDSKTAGLVAINNGTMTSTFVEGNNIINYRAVNDNYNIESKGNVGGLVFENNGSIENSFSNVYLETQSAFTGGFVYTNNINGRIINSYSTATNKSSIAHGQFTGIGTNGRDILNHGSYTNCYYLIMEDEVASEKEKATAIHVNNNPVNLASTWQGFSIASNVNGNGIWQLLDNECPRLCATYINTISFRILTSITETTDEDADSKYTIYNYSYEKYNLGSQNNPLIIDQAENFAKYIIDNANELDINGKIKPVFGVSMASNNVLSQNNNVRYVRLVNNLNFENITSASKHNGYYLYNVIFAGILDGNGMSLNNLNIVTDTAQLEDFGLFANIGVSSNISSAETIVKNLNLSLRTYKSSDSSRAGILAGTIRNSSIINVKINGGATDNDNMTIGASNMAGALAGLICDDYSNTSLIDITIENVAVEANYGSLGGEITSDSKDVSNGFYNKFSIKNTETMLTIEKGFASLYDKTNNITKLYNNGIIRKDVSYAGIVAGVIMANNSSVEVCQAETIADYRSEDGAGKIDNIIVKNNAIIRTADTAGGLFGYVAENTLIKNSKLILSDGQIIKANNFAGGLVGENHGIIERCNISYDEETQKQLDATILNNTRGIGKNNLFETADNVDYTVAIGGIAGYSNNGVIIDSYSKVNVVKSLSFIAGGVVGYTENCNYISYVYITGAVSGKFITGGVVGISVSKQNDDETESSQYLKMNEVFALNDWNYVDDITNVRHNITQILYNNQKMLYVKSESYYNFYIKMPEVGNLDVVQTGNNYGASHDKYYVGSVVGNAIISKNGDIEKIISSSKDAYGNYSYLNRYKFNESSYVYSDTLGMYSSTGTASAGDKQDSYFNTTFAFNNSITSTTLNLYSYRIAYQISSNINSYDLIDIIENDTNTYFDIISFPQTFTAQEYIQQMLGEYYYSNASANVNTRNLFRYDYNVTDRTNTDTNNPFVSSTSEKVWKMNDYLPEYNDGLYATTKVIADKSDLNKALTSVASGMTYVINPNNCNIISNADDYSINYDTYTSQLISIANMISVGDVYKGKIVDTYKPTIKFSASNVTTINTIFNAISGATFENIKFVFDFSALNMNISKVKEFANLGFITNNLQNSTIINCDFEIILPNVSYLNSGNIENVGLLFGQVSNSIFSNNTFKILSTEITINNENIENFGLIAGYIYGSTIENNTIYLPQCNITLSNYSDNLNLGQFAGTFAYSTYINNKICGINADGTICENYTLNIEKFNDISDNSLSIGLFGFANNSNIQNLLINTQTQLYLDGNGSHETINASQLVGEAYAVNISNVTIKNRLEIHCYESTEKLNIGTIIANNIANSKISYSSIAHAGDISSDLQKQNKLSIGGFIGRTGNSGNLIESCSTFAGNVSSEIDINEKIECAIGGIVGRTSGNIGISNILSACENIASTLIGTNSTSTVGMGGIVGIAETNLSICNFTVLSSIGCNVAINVNIAGVVGLNLGVADISNGFIYTDIPVVTLGDVDTSVCSVTNGYVSSNSQNVYYAQEFVKNNYEFDSMFSGFALADIYGTISEYSQVSNLADREDVTGDNEDTEDTNSDFECVMIGSLRIPVPQTLQMDENSNEFDYIKMRSMFNPQEITTMTNVPSGDFGTTNSYYVVLEPISFSIDTLNVKTIISGRSIETGKVVINVEQVEGAEIIKYAISTNNGVLSNVYLNITTVNEKGLNVALVGTNNGLITNVYMYGYSTAQYAIADTNNGKILKSASSTIFKGTETDIYGLVNTNLENALICDCYSSNFGYTANDGKITTVYGLANINKGVIKYSFYYIPEIMEYDNNLLDVCDKRTTEVIDGKNVIKSSGNNYYCDNSMNPDFVATRPTIWSDYVENGHANLIGFKDINGAIVIKLKINNNLDEEGNLIEYENLADVKDILNSEAETSNNAYKFGYKILFYQTENLPNYNVVRINSGAKLISYINSLRNGLIPLNTLVLLEGELIVNYELPSFSISASAMVVGVNYNAILNDGGTQVIEEKNTQINFNVDGYNLSHEIIKHNYGIIAGITFVDFSIVNSDRNTSIFAPITYNSGIIYDLKFDNLFLNGGSALYVSGVVNLSYKGAKISHCEIFNYTIISNAYLNYFCNEVYPESKIYECYYDVGTSVYVEIYAMGKNGEQKI